MNAYSSFNMPSLVSFHTLSEHLQPFLFDGWEGTWQSLGHDTWSSCLLTTKASCYIKNFSVAYTLNSVKRPFKKWVRMVGSTIHWKKKFLGNKEPRANIPPVWHIAHLFSKRFITWLETAFGFSTFCCFVFLLL